MMILIAACSLVILAFANYRISGSVLYPSVLFCSWWSVVLLLLWSFSALFYPVGPEGLYIYIIGAVAYSAGSLITWLVPRFRSSAYFGMPGHNPRTGRVFVVLLISIMAALPLLIVYTRTMAAYNSFSESFWQSVRSSYKELDHVQGGGPMTVANLAPIYLVTAFIAILELTANPRHRYRRTLLTFISLVFVFQLLTVMRTNIMVLLCGIVAIVAVRRGRLPTRAILLSVLAFLFIFGLNQFGLDKGAEWSGPVSERAASFGRACAGYTFGPLVAFDQVIRHPGQVRNTWKIYKPFVHIANKFGADLPELEQHLDYTEMAPDLETNVYTFYFSYYEDFGIPGVVIASILFGCLSTAVFRMARCKSPMGVVLFPLVVFGIVMSAFGECVFQAVTLWVKAALCVVFFYRLLPSTSVQAILTRSENHRSLA